MKKLVMLMLTMVLICSSADLPEHQQRTWNATFALYGSSKSQKIEHQFFCTAVAYERIPDGYRLLTAGHCVDPTSAPKDAIYSVDNEIREIPQLQPIKVIRHVEDRASHIDYGILELKSQKQYAVEPFDMEAQIPSLEEPVYMVHFSRGLGKQISLGRVSSKQMNLGAYDGECQGDNDVCADNFLIQVFAAPGASGSLVISLQTDKPVGILIGNVDAGFTVEPLRKITESMKEKP